jgi:hypothetical protein
MSIPFSLFSFSRGNRMTVKAGCPMKLHRFPMDTQRCPLEVGSCEYHLVLLIDCGRNEITFELSLEKLLIPKWAFNSVMYLVFKETVMNESICHFSHDLSLIFSILEHSRILDIRCNLSMESEQNSCDQPWHEDVTVWSDIFSFRQHIRRV